MNVRSIRSIFSARARDSRFSLVGLLALFCLLVLNACGGGSSAAVYDNARVLNVPRVQKAASQLSVPVAVYTTSTFQGTAADFQRATVQKLGNNPDKIVMAIDTTNRRIYIARGTNVSANTTQAVNAFASNFKSGDYTNASVAALSSLQNSTSSRSPGSGLFQIPATLLCCILPLLVLLFLVLFGVSRRSALNRGMTGSGLRGLFGMGRSPYRRASPYDQEPYNQGYGPPNQGYGPPNQGYGPPNQGGGMNPWAAGGLGAAAGGLAGYELGKRQGERDTERQDNDFGSGGNFGGGSGSSFGGGDDSGSGGSFGGGGDFGSGGSFGGGDDSGSGGTFGGGGDFGNSDDFGGGGDFGGGSGGSFGNDDFGGGSGGNF